MKGSSANIETVFSGAKRLLGDFASTLGPHLLEMYAFIHYNFPINLMQPTVEEIVKAYEALHGSAPMVEDVEDEEEELCEQTQPNEEDHVDLEDVSGNGGQAMLR